MKLFGVPYVIRNRSSSSRPDRRIAWRHFTANRWRYELTPTADGGPTVTETFDPSRADGVTDAVVRWAKFRSATGGVIETLRGSSGPGRRVSPPDDTAGAPPCRRAHPLDTARQRHHVASRSKGRGPFAQVGPGRTVGASSSPSSWLRMNVFGWYLRRSRSRSSGRSSPRDSFTCSRTPVIAVRTRLRPDGRVLGEVGQPLGSEDEERAEGQDDDLAPADRVEHRRSPSSVAASATALQRRRAAGQAASSVTSNSCEAAPAAHDLDGHRLARVVRVDRDDELLGAADRLALDGDDDVLLADAGVRRRAARLDVEHQRAVAGAVGDRAGVDPERGVHRRPGGDELLGDVADGVDRDGEAEARRCRRRPRRWRC